MRDRSRRSIRTFLQGILAACAAVPTTVAAFGVPAAVAAKVGGVLALLVAVVSFIVNALEDADIIPALLKAPASDGANPVPDDAGSV